MNERNEQEVIAAISTLVMAWKRVVSPVVRVYGATVGSLKECGMPDQHFVAEVSVSETNPIISHSFVGSPFGAGNSSLAALTDLEGKLRQKLQGEVDTMSRALHDVESH